MTLEWHDCKTGEYLQNEFQSAEAIDTYNMGASFKDNLNSTSSDTMRIGLVGDPDSGKSEWIDGFIEASKDYRKTESSSDCIKEFINTNGNVIVQVDILGLLYRGNTVEILNQIQDREDIEYLIIEHADHAPEIEYDTIVEIQKDEITHDRLIKLHCEDSIMSSDFTPTPAYS